MSAGELNRRITVQAKQLGQDDLGQPSAAWGDVVVNLPAGILSMKGKEYATVSAEVSKVQASFKIRWRTDITAAMRILHDGGIFNIEAVLPEYASRRYVYLACSIGANNG